jgi:hypothetical protein
MQLLLDIIVFKSSAVVGLHVHILQCNGPSMVLPNSLKKIRQYKHQKQGKAVTNFLLDLPVHFGSYFGNDEWRNLPQYLVTSMQVEQFVPK